MSDKIQVYKLAKELGLPNAEMVKVLKDEGIEVASAKSSIEMEIADLVREHLAEAAKADEADAAETDEGEAAEAAGSGNENELHMKPPIIVKDLAEVLSLKPNVIIAELMKQNVFAAINQAVDVGVAEKICANHDRVLIVDKRSKPTPQKAALEQDAPETRVFVDAEVNTRPPVVAFLGHVDHGKTSLLDKIRNSAVTAGEAGGITQHVGAYNVERNGHIITFLDTPGHEAFTAMRARGADTTDVVVLVVAADDGFMPQTVEALNHARAAGVQIVVALNKMDLAAANPDQVLTQMQQNNLSPEDWGGETGVIRVSAETGDGIEELLDRLVLESEMMELKANADLPVRAVVLESQLEPGLGPAVNILIKNGTVRQGETVICGQYFGRVKALINCRGEKIKKAGPSIPVKLVGLNGVPSCGTILAGCKNEKLAKKLTQERMQDHRQETLATPRKASLEDLFEQIQKEDRDDLKLILKADVQGTSEAITDSLNNLNTDKIHVNLIHSGVGSISENDVQLASTSDAIVVGFHVRVNPGVNKLAKKEGVEIRLYSVIYELVEQIREAMEGMLKPDVREEGLGHAKILQIFKTSKSGKICGCAVSKGVARVGAKARVHREGDLIYNGSIASLRRFKDDVKEVREGFECGIRLDNFNDFEVDDEIEIYEYISTPAKL
jgi:translation initiation factor IF-2